MLYEYFNKIFQGISNIHPSILLKIALSFMLLFYPVLKKAGMKIKTFPDNFFFKIVLIFIQKLLQEIQRHFLFR